MVVLQNRSITTHIIFVSIFLALAPLFILSFYASHQKTQEIHELQMKHMGLLLNSIIEHTDSKIRHYKDLVTSLSNSPYIIQSLLNDEPNQKAIKDFLVRHRNIHLYHQIYLSKDSKLVASSIDKNNLPSTDLSNPLLANTPLANGIKMAKLKKNTHISELSYFGPSNEPASFITAPIINNNKTIGTISIELNEDFFFELIRSDINFGNTGELVAAKLRDDGTIVATIPLKYSPNAFHDQTILYETSSSNGLPQATQGAYGKGIVTDYRGKEVLSTWGYLPLLDWGVQIKIDTEEIRADIWQSNQAFFAFLLGIGIMVLAIAFYSTRLITRPILHLADSIKRFGDGEHIQAHPGSSLEITQLANAFNAMEDKVTSHLLNLQEQAKTIEEYNRTLETQIEQRTKNLKESHEQITALLNNSGQGFLSIGPSLHVRPEYSKECEVLLGNEIAQKPLPELLFQKEVEQTSFKKILSLYFDTSDSLQKEAYLSLLDAKININSYDISIEYKPLNDDTLMLILTDISRLCTLESEIQQERTLLSYITMALKDKRQFFDALDAYKSEIQTFEQHIKNTKLDKHKLQMLYRKIHTYKGIFLQYALPNLPKSLHALEEDISHKLNEAQVAAASIDSNYFKSANEALEKDIELLIYYLGKEFIVEKESLTISKEQYLLLDGYVNKIENQIGVNHPLILEIKKLLFSFRLVPLRSLMAAYPQLAFQLAIQMNKEIENFDIEGGDFLVDPHQYGDFTKAMIHLFNNAIDHGIESPMEREEIGKNPVGSLKCTISQSPDFFTIQLSDDGRGLDREQIQKKALQRGLTIDLSSSDSDIFLLIFEDGFSLKEDVTQISGRGVGLSALKAEVEALGGSLTVTSFLGKGSTFSFTIPFQNQGALSDS